MEKIIQTAGRNQLGDFAPDFAHFNDDILFGENWNNQDIDLKTRCILTVVALMSSGVTDSSLTYHLENAKAHGVTRVEIAAIVTHVGFYVGWPKAWAVFRLAKDVWSEEASAEDARRLMPLRCCFLSARQTTALRSILRDRVISHPYQKSRLEFLT